MVSGSPQMAKFFKLLGRAAKSDATVLLRGASGTGKELAATALHRESRRADGPLRAVNCATFTSELLASELFGHRRGAFTGAVKDRKGLLAESDGGTLFLDEIAELPLDLQARTLRVLQTRRFTPVGGTIEQEVDLRLVSATNASLRQLVAEHRFREDLMYRLRVVVLYLPPLKERTGDIDVLTSHFVDEFNERGGRIITSVSPAAWARMRAYPWPGNVRELRNNLEQAFVLGEGSELTEDELAPELRGSGFAPEVGEQPGAHATLDDLERAELLSTFREAGGHRGRMAASLGISRATLYRRLKKHGLI
jgi:two-component system, NtrC family, response regulator AtoC